MCFQYESNEMT